VSVHGRESMHSVRDQPIPSMRPRAVNRPKLASLGTMSGDYAMRLELTIVPL